MTIIEIRCFEKKNDDDGSEVYDNTASNEFFIDLDKNFVYSNKKDQSETNKISISKRETLQSLIEKIRKLPNNKNIDFENKKIELLLATS